MKKFTMLLLLAITISVVLGSGIPTAFAANDIDVSNYTNVLDDLQAADNFDVANFLETDDFDLDVIQVAESEDGELFVYVYQHKDDTLCVANQIRFSPYVGDNFGPKDYDLLLLNRSGTLAKYLVLDFEVKEDVIRFYDIVAIFRNYIPGVDEPVAGNQTVNKFAIEVGKLFKATTQDGVVSYTEEHSEVINITNLYVGNIAYRSGIELWGVLVNWAPNKMSSCISHYVAFSTDLRIDQILEADLTYVTQNWTYENWAWEDVLNGRLNSSKFVYESPVKQQLTLKPEKCTVSTGGVFSRQYSWERIQSSSNFVDDPSCKDQLSETDVKSVKECDWVLRFAETEFNISVNPVKGRANSTSVSEVTILRLKYLTNGKVYNMGVVSNVQTGGGSAGGAGKEIVPWWVWVLIGLVVVVILCLLIKPLGTLAALILKGIGIGLKWTCIVLYYVIISPYLLIKWIAQKARERKEYAGR